MTLGQFDRFTATLKPRRTDDLKPGAASLTGQRLEWEAVWVIGEEDKEHGVSQDYVGTFACALLTDLPEHPDFVWVPQCDLTDVDVIT